MQLLNDKSCCSLYYQHKVHVQKQTSSQISRNKSKKYRGTWHLHVTFKDFLLQVTKNKQTNINSNWISPVCFTKNCIWYLEINLIMLRNPCLPISVRWKQVQQIACPVKSDLSNIPISGHGHKLKFVWVQSCMADMWHIIAQLLGFTGQHEVSQPRVAAISQMNRLGEIWTANYTFSH